MLLKRGLSNSSDEERKQVPFSCETLIVTKWKELCVLVLVMHAVPRWGSGFETRGLLLGLSPNRPEPLAPVSQAGV